MSEQRGTERERAVSGATTTRQEPVFRVNGVLCEGYTALIERIEEPNNWCGWAPFPDSYPPAFWGNSDPEFAEYREGEAHAAPDSQGLPAPLRARREAEDDPKADAELRDVGVACVSHRDGRWTYGWRYFGDGRWLPDELAEFGTADASIVNQHGITTRQLRARLPIRLTGPVERVEQREDDGVCEDCGGDGGVDDHLPPYGCETCKQTGRIDGRRGEGEDYDGGRNQRHAETWHDGPEGEFVAWVAQDGPADYRSASWELARRDARDTDAVLSTGRRVGRAWLLGYSPPHDRLPL